jgi:ABC-type transporter Mla subunit MlaD
LTGGELAFLKEEIKAGVIIISSLIILSGFTILIGGSTLFEEFDTYYVKVMNAAGLEPGSQVKLGGVRIGSVTGIEAPEGPGESITITIGIKEGTALYRGTKAIITQIGFVGDIYLLLAVDKTTAERIEVGEVIPSFESVDFNILMVKAGEISVSLDTLIKDIDRLFSQGNIQNIEDLIKEVALVLEELTELFKDNKEGISDLIEEAKKTIEKAGDMASAFEDTAKSVNKTSETLDGAVDLQSQNMTNLLTALSEATEDLQDVLQEIKNKPWSLLYKEGKGVDD